MDENKSERLMSIQRSEAVVIIASTLESWSPQDARLINQSYGCIWNQKDQPRRTHDIKAGVLRTLNDAYSVNHATIAQKYKPKFEEQSRPHYSVQALEKRPRCWGANVVCLANLASHFISCDLIRLCVMCLQEESSISLESIALDAL